MSEEYRYYTETYDNEDIEVYQVDGMRVRRVLVSPKSDISILKWVVLNHYNYLDKSVEFKELAPEIQKSILENLLGV